MTRFATTRWSLIEHARDDPASANAALDALCRDYRAPVLAYVRHSGYDRNDAEDLTQEFFVGFIERRWFLVADRDRGRFRSLLLTSLQRFLSDQRARAQALKRGGAVHRVGLDDVELVSPARSPEQAFTHVWAMTVLEHAVERLSQEWAQAGKADQFQALLPFLESSSADADFGALADRLGIRHNTLSVQLYRLRERLRQLTRLELLQTVGNAQALETELSELRDALEPLLTE